MRDYLPSSFCCARMRDHSTLTCTMHHSPQECPDVLVVWSPRQGAGLPVRDGGTSFVIINHCPWCGTNIKETEE